TPENFKAAFTTAEGWGSYVQEISADRFLASLELSWGTLILDTLSLVVPDDRSFSKINVVIDSRNVDFKYSTQGSENSIRFGSSVLLQRGQVLKVTLS
ncbi:MAG: hypothetical protein KJT03_11420, partial [Verrucomicrobiae bacterium]|nr:hypothetical protein [Verrucomicrobiae bacterium]